MNNYIKGFGVFLTIGFSSEIVYHLYTLFKRRKQNESRNDTVGEVLFFPDKEVACKNFFIGDSGCHNLRCRFTHEENSLSRLFRQLASARTTLDVCVFLICSADLGDILINAHQKGMKVRIICDDEQVDISGSQVWRFRKEGVNVRTDNSSYLMHHKFVVIDKAILLNGSFNWTRQAISGNQENLMVINNNKLVASFSEEFETLWTKFEPNQILK